MLNMFAVQEKFIGIARPVMARLPEGVRVRLPSEENILPMAGSFINTLAWRVPATVATSAIAVVSHEASREANNTFVPLAFLAFSLFTLATGRFDYKLLREGRAASSPRTNLIHTVLNAVHPNSDHMRGIDLASSIVASSMGFFGLSSDPGSMVALYLALKSGNSSILGAYLFSQVVVGLFQHVPYSLFLRRDYSGRPLHQLFVEESREILQNLKNR